MHTAYGEDTMSHQDESKRETEFLQEQVREAERKVARQHEALTACTDCLEAEGLQQLLHNAQMERDLLRDLLKQQTGAESVSLEALIMQRANRLHDRAASLSGHWKRGQPTPPEYWEAENQRNFLLEILRHFHAGQTPSAPEKTSQPAVAHPWFDADANGGTHTVANLDDVHAEIVQALASAGYPAKHLEIMVQPQGLVVVTGQAHSAADREQALAAIMSVENVWEIVSDIKIVEEPRCPVCHPPAPKES
jgi:hypothetical protein